MRIVVTGSAGFVGSHTSRALENGGNEVIRADKQTGQDLTLRPKRWKPKPDLIIHLAGACSTPGSLRDPLGTFRDTVLTAVNVLEIARWDRIPVILTSSVKARDGQTPYGAAKQMVELWAQEYRSAYHLPVIINRPGTIYGPGQEGSPESGWIAWFCEARDTGQTVTINGTGEQIRDLLHVTDYVRLLLLQAGNVTRYDTGQIWDVGGGRSNAVTVNQIVAHLKLPHVYGPDRYGDAMEYIGVNDVPGWAPETNWRESETLR